MKISIIPTETFEKEFKHLGKKYPSLTDDMRLLSFELLNYPEIGKDLGGGLRKIRVAIKSKGKGKRGGARVITYNIIMNVIEKKIFLLFIYDKSERENLSKQEIRNLLIRNGFLI